MKRNVQKAVKQRLVAAYRRHHHTRRPAPPDDLTILIQEDPTP